MYLGREGRFHCTANKRKKAILQQRQGFGDMMTTKACWQPPEAGEARNRLYLKPPKEAQTPSLWTSHTDIGLLASRE